MYLNYDNIMLAIRIIYCVINKNITNAVVLIVISLSIVLTYNL